ncbi:MAG: SusD/RagB family nutrient-binding outer membrane lipoprotein, partial [Cyclobacteriaceae bacterium]
MKKRIYSLLMAVSMVIVSSCDLDQYLDDPNAVTRDTASPTLILTRVQVDLADLFDDLSFLGMQLTRIVNQDAEFYEQAYIPTAFNVIWQTSYSDILNDIRLLEPLAEEGGFRKHLGIARVIKAYV